MNQLRSQFSDTIRVLYDELNAAKDKERDIRENGGSWTPNDGPRDEE